MDGGALAAVAVPGSLRLAGLGVAPEPLVGVTAFAAIASLVWVIERAGEVAISVLTLELQFVRWFTHPIAMAALTVVIGVFVLTRKPAALRDSASAAIADTATTGASRQTADTTASASPTPGAASANDQIEIPCSHNPPH